MLPNYNTPYLNAFDALRCAQKSKQRSVFPGWMLPYRMPLVQPPAGCPPVPDHVPDRSKLRPRTQMRAWSGW
jgi:hypothetical protein